MFMVSPRTARKWADRLPGRGRGRDGRPVQPAALEPDQDPASRWCARSCGCGGVTGSARSRSPAGSACRPRPCTRCWCAAGSTGSRHIDRVTGEPIRRYEHPHPGSLIHVDVTKFGNIPDGGGHGASSAASRGKRNAQTTAHRTGTAAHSHRHADSAPRSCTPSSTTTPASPTSRSAPTRRPTPRSVSCTAPSPGSPTAASPSSGCCPTTASAYRSHAWRDACADLGITHKRTRPYRPQTNGKIERFHRTLADGWAYARFYDSETERRAALPGWLHFYNHHRLHSAIGGTPISRLNNLPGHHT